MTRPLVSIVVPCYKSEKHIRQCVDSILAQTFQDWEAIFVDDKPSKEMIDIMAEYSNRDSRIRYYVWWKKTNPATARNKGIVYSIGDYIAFLDADDWMEPDKLERVLLAMERNPAAEWSIHYVYYEYSNHTEHRTDNPSKDRWVSGVAYATFRKNYLNKIKFKWGYVFNEQMPRSDDMDLTMRILDVPFVVIPEFLSHYRILDSSLTIRNSASAASLDVVKMTIRNRRYRDTPYYTKELLLSVFDKITGLDIVKIKKGLF